MCIPEFPAKCRFRFSRSGTREESVFLIHFWGMLLWMVMDHTLSSKGQDQRNVEIVGKLLLYRDQGIGFLACTRLKWFTGILQRTLFQFFFFYWGQGTREMGQLWNRCNSGLATFSSALVMKSSEDACPKGSAHVGFPERFSPRHHPADIYSLCCIKSEGDTLEGGRTKTLLEWVYWKWQRRNGISSTVVPWCP